jgi:exocyst complex protein 7
LTAFEESIKVQKTLSVPDYELRMSIIKEVKDFVVPIYTNFYEKYRNVPFTKNPSKYLKYDPSEVEAALGSLFES